MAGVAPNPVASNADEDAVFRVAADKQYASCTGKLYGGTEEHIMADDATYPAMRSTFFSNLEDQAGLVYPQVLPTATGASDR